MIKLYSNEELQAMLILSERYYSVGRYADAELLANQLRTANPFEVNYYKLSAVIQSAQSNHEYAYNLYRLGTTIDPMDVHLWLGMAVSGLNMGNTAKAQEIMKHIRKIAGHDQEVLDEVDKLGRLIQ